LEVEHVSGGHVVRDHGVVHVNCALRGPRRAAGEVHQGGILGISRFHREQTGRVRPQLHERSHARTERFGTGEFVAPRSDEQDVLEFRQALPQRSHLALVELRRGHK
jgi:hypothetical protein